jgi:hypothetical protein
MNYYYLKLGAGNCEADERLGSKPPSVAIYFDDFTEADYAAGKGKFQAKLFYQAGSAQNHAQTVMVVIHNARIFFLRPASKVTFGKPIEKDDGQYTRKIMKVRRLRKKWCKDVPPVLAGIGSSQHHGRQTFTQIGHWGNMKAIDYVLGRIEEALEAGEEHWDPAKQEAAQLLECLGSTEFETLIGKLFEARGCHVPAYLGGTLKEIDLFAHNDSNGPISIDKITIPARRRVSIQVKTWAYGGCPANVDYFIAFKATVGAKSFDADWVLARVKECPSVLQWLKRSLNWLPSSFLEIFGI